MGEKLRPQEAFVEEYPTDRIDRIRLLVEQSEEVEKFPGIMGWIDKRAEKDPQAARSLKNELPARLTSALEFIDHNDILTKNTTEDVERWAKKAGVFKDRSSADSALLLLDIQQRRERIVKEVIHSKINQGDMRAAVWSLELVCDSVRADREDYDAEASKNRREQDLSPEKRQQNEENEAQLRKLTKELVDIEKVFSRLSFDIVSLAEDEKPNQFGRGMTSSMMEGVHERIIGEISRTVEKE